MPRKLRIQYPGAMYHVMNRGDQRENIYRDTTDRERFLATLGEACAKTAWEVHAYYLLSYGHYLNPPEQRPKWLRVDRVLGERRIPGDTEAGRQEFAAQMELRRAEESTADYEPLRRDWIWGSERFRQELLAAVEGQVGASHYGVQRQETTRQKAERILQEELTRLGCKEDQLLGRRKGDAAKVGVARRLRKETTLSLKQIAERLNMGSWSYVSNLLNSNPSRQPQPLLPLFQ